MAEQDTEQPGGRERPLTAPVFSQARAEVGTVELPATVFTEPLRRALLADVVRMQTASRRAGSAATKEKGEVRGGGKKPWKQKGTGRARAGSIRSPLWPGGGPIFGPHPRDYSYTMPKRALSKALAVALASKIRDGEVTVVSGLALSAPSTRTYAKFLDGAKAGTKALLVTAEAAERNVLLSSRNVPGARVLPASEVNARDVVACSRLLLAEGAYEALVARIGRSGAAR